MERCAVKPVRRLAVFNQDRALRSELTGRRAACTNQMAVRNCDTTLRAAVLLTQASLI
ncbi:hypothetical protein IG631_00990 [Alternaria alternata]|nr:hypothetical protein IG631_00990 [Alternaria alternata]